MPTLANPRPTAKPMDLFAFAAGDHPGIIRAIKTGLPVNAFQRFLDTSHLTAQDAQTVIGIPKSTLARRQNSGRFTPQESERVYRLVHLFSLATDLFEGDRMAAKEWMEHPQRAFDGESPIERAATELGARDVEQLIGRLEHGVFA